MARPRYVFGDGCGICSEPAVCTVAQIPIGARCRKKLTAIMQSAGWRLVEIREYFAGCGRIKTNRVCVDCGRIFAEPKRAGPPRLRCTRCDGEKDRRHNRSRRARDQPAIELIPIPTTAGA